MRDIYEFLLHTLNVSYAAVYILIIKRVLRDKLTPLWQFSLWGILAAVLIFPVNVSGILSFFTETVKTFLSESWTLSHPTAFFPFLPTSLPTSAEDCIFCIYLMGVLVLLLKYAFSSIKLKTLISKCPETDGETLMMIKETAAKYSLPVCKAVTMQGLEAPFVFGIIKPTLVLPEGKTNEKIILHELLHLKYKDVLWGFPIAIFRSIHWCNPLLWYCFNKINNDIEELCDARAINLLSGEERREYGNIILSMANKKYPSSLGTSSIANGGKNIRSRIETIARFKLYPKGNALVAICMIVILASNLFIGVNTVFIPGEITNVHNTATLNVALSAARSFYCTTPAGAIDTYAHSIIERNGIFRAAASPLSQHKDIKNTLYADMSDGKDFSYMYALDSIPAENDYYIYNFEETEKNVYSAYLALKVYYYGSDTENENNEKVAYQKLKIYKEGVRWVAVPQTDFQYAVTYQMSGDWGCDDLPGYVYTAQTELFTVKVKYQLCHSVSNITNSLNQPAFNAYFDQVYISTSKECIYVGPEELKSTLTRFGLATQSFDGEKNFEITAAPSYGTYSSSSTDGSSISSKTLKDGWDNTIHCGGGGYSGEYKKNTNYLPEHIAAAIYLNGELYEEVILEREG